MSENSTPLASMRSARPALLRKTSLDIAQEQTFECVEHLQAATRAFNRARGHQSGLDFQRFYDTFIYETSANMPREVAQRVFTALNLSASGELSCSEFLAGILLFIQGTRENHLKFVFELILNGKAQRKANHEETAAFLRCFGPPSTIVASFETSLPDLTNPAITSITIAQFCSMLHPTPSKEVAEDEFLEFANSFKRDTSAFLLVDWIGLMGNCLVCMLNEDQPQDGKSPRALLRQIVTEEAESDLKPLFVPQQLSRTQRDAIRHVLIQLLESLPSTTPKLQSGIESTIKLEKAIVDEYRASTNNDQLVQWIWEWTEYLKTSPTSLQVSHQCQFHKWFVLGLCCAQSKSIEQVYRAMFALFDSENRGYLNESNLVSFFQLARVGDNQLQSVRAAYAAMSSVVLSSSSVSPPPSPAQIGQTQTDTGAIVTFKQFVDFAKQQEGLSLSEVQVVLTVFHLHASTKLTCNVRLLTLLRGVGCNNVSSMDDIYDFPSRGFLLCEHVKWREVAQKLCKHENANESNNSTALDSSSHNAAKELAKLLENEAETVSKNCVVIPAYIWLGISFWFAHHHECEASMRDWRQWTIAPKLLSLLGLPSMYMIGVTVNDRGTTASCNQTHCCYITEHCSIQIIAYAVNCRLRLLDQTKPQLCKCTIEWVLSRNTQSSKTSVEISQDFFTLGFSELLHNLPVSPNDEEICDLSLNLEFCREEAEISKDKQLDCTPKVGGPATCGLVNLGNTCFMNSALQSLAVTPLLREYFELGEFYNDQAAQLPQPHKHLLHLKKESQPSSLVEAFGLLLQKLSHVPTVREPNNTSKFTPLNMYLALGSLLPHMCDGTQQDAQEFISSFISRLSEELQRHPLNTHEQEESVLSPQSRTILSRIATMSHEDFQLEVLKGRSESNGPEKISPTDSDGRHDSIVAMEWWISHLINEPSVITCFFSGQFKSVLTCTACGKQSSRFEPFSSLQLPIVNSEKTVANGLDVTAILYFEDSPKARLPLRIVVQARNDWTVANVLELIRRDHFKAEDAGKQSILIAAECRCSLIEDIYDEDMLLVAIPMPIHILELDASFSNMSFGHAMSDVYGSTMKPPSPGDSIMVKVSSDRLVQGMVSAAHGGLGSYLKSYDVLVTEGFSNGTTIRGTEEIASLAGMNSRVIYLRFVHRSSMLAPFYCTDPHRYIVTGTPIMIRTAAAALTGSELYNIVSKRLFGRSLHGSPRRSSPGERAYKFIIRRVKDDGKCCSQCHWVKNCSGCLVDEAGNDLLSFAMDETIAIDWEDTPPPAILSTSTEDDESYINFRKQHSQSISDSLAMLCSEEKLEAQCSVCQQKQETAHPTYSPHTKQLSIWSLPPILILQLKRFELAVGPHGDYSWQKLVDRVDFPVHNLDLRSFLSAVDGAHADDADCGQRCTQLLDARVLRGMAFLQDELGLPLDSASRSCASYDLYAVINHSGALNSGHYTAAVRRADSAEWWLADDASVSRLDASQLAPSAAAYVLFYVRRDVATSADARASAEASDGRVRARHPREFFPRRPVRRAQRPVGERRGERPSARAGCAVM